MFNIITKWAKEELTVVLQCGIFFFAWALNVFTRGKWRNL